VSASFGINPIIAKRYAAEYWKKRSQQMKMHMGDFALFGEANHASACGSANGKV
jgi:hypothetical protein